MRANWTSSPFSSPLIWGFSYHILLSLFCSQIPNRCKGLGGRRHPDCQSWRTPQCEWATGSCRYFTPAPSGRHSSTQPPSPVRVYRVTHRTTPGPPGGHMLWPHGTAAVSFDRSQAIDCWAPPLPGASSGTSQFIGWKGRDGTQHVNWWILSGAGGRKILRKSPNPMGGPDFDD